MFLTGPSPGTGGSNRFVRLEIQNHPNAHCPLPTANAFRKHPVSSALLSGSLLDPGQMVRSHGGATVDGSAELCSWGRRTKAK